VAVATIVDYLCGLGLPDTPAAEPAAVLAAFRQDFYQCLTARADALFEITDAVLCTDGPVRSLVDLSLAAEHCRGHGALYDGLNCAGSTSPGCGRRRPTCPCRVPVTAGSSSLSRLLARSPG
jgi:DDE superfamily endonuclease